MKSHDFIALILSIGLMLLDGISTLAQDYPTKPVRMVTLEAGGGSDIIARVVAQGITTPLGRPVVVENRATAAVTVAQAAPDGYTLLSIGSLMWINPLLQKAPYDPIKDFVPVSSTHRNPFILVVHPKLPANSVKELVALARTRPGELNYASAGAGGSAHLAAELFKLMAHVNIIHIPYKGTNQGINDLISGQVQLMFNSTLAMPHVKAGRLKVLAVTSTEPGTLVPGVPTVAASGFPGFEFGNTPSGIFAPAATPEAIIKRLNQEIVRLLERPEVKERLFNVGAEAAPITSVPMSTLIKLDMERLGKVIKDIGIRVE